MTSEHQVTKIIACFDDSQIYSLETTWGTFSAETGNLIPENLVTSIAETHGKADESISCDAIEFESDEKFQYMDAWSNDSRVITKM